MARRPVRGHHGKPPPPALPAEDGYFQQSKRPLMCLLLLVPLLLFYEIGALVFNAVPLTSRNMLAWAVQQMGWRAHLLPGVLVVGILLLWHLVRRDTGKIRATHLLGMAAESLAWAPGLLLVYMVVSKYIPRPMPIVAMLTGVDGSGPQAPALLNEIIMSVGAGIYEELVFRLLLVGLAGYLLHKCGMKRETACVLMVLISAALFSWHHYIGPQPFELFSFIWRVVAGVYLGFLFVWRGFGITAMAHAAFDVMVSLMNHFNGAGG